VPVRIAATRLEPAWWLDCALVSARVLVA